MGSPRFTLNREDYKKIGKGALIAILGALLTYGSEVVGSVDFGEYMPFVVAAWSVIVNAGWKYIQNKK